MAYVSQSAEYDQVRGLLQKSLTVDELVHQWPQSQVDACLEGISRNVMLVPSGNVPRKKSQRQHQQSFYDSVPATVVETDAGNLVLKRDMNDKVERFMTFFHKNWPRNVPILFSKLAEAGFFYTGVHDTIECIGCKGRISKWGNGETAMKEHNRLYPHCKVARGSDRREEPYQDLVNESQGGTEGTLKGQSGTLLLSSNDVSGSEDELESYRFAKGRPIHPSQLDSLSAPTDFITKYSKCPEMVMEEARLETYRQWPGSHCQIPENLARAGFFATGKDQVKCFSCGCEVQDWGKDDDPWLIHARFSPWCAWLQQQRDPSFRIPSDQTSTWPPTPLLSGIPYSEDRTRSMSSSVSSELQAKARDEFRREKEDIQMRKLWGQVEKKNQKIKEAKLLQEREEDVLQLHVQQHMSDSGQAEEIARTEVMKRTQTRKRPYKNSEGLPTAMSDEKAAEKYTEGACALPGNLEGATRPPEDGYICWELPTEDGNETSSEKNAVNGKVQVKCLPCGCEVQDWGKDDDLWLIHARFSPWCAWLQQQRGPSFRIPSDQASTWPPAPLLSGVPYSEDRTRSMSFSVTSELQTKARDEFRREKEDAQMRKLRRQVEKKNQKIKAAKLLQEISGPKTDLSFKEFLMKLAEHFTKADINRLCDFFELSSTKLRILRNPKPAKTFLFYLWRKEIIKSDNVIVLHDALTQLKMLGATNKLKELHKGMKQAHEDMQAEEMERLRQKYLCKICFNNSVKIVFRPCRHLCCCRDCARRVKECPCCRSLIDERIPPIFHDL